MSGDVHLPQRDGHMSNNIEHIFADTTTTLPDGNAAKKTIPDVIQRSPRDRNVSSAKIESVIASAISLAGDITSNV